jgi:hypothetical protein
MARDLRPASTSASTSRSRGVSPNGSTGRAGPGWSAACDVAEVPENVATLRVVSAFVITTVVVGCRVLAEDTTHMALDQSSKGDVSRSCRHRSWERGGWRV